MRTGLSLAWGWSVFQTLQHDQLLLPYSLLHTVPSSETLFPSSSPTSFLSGRVPNYISFTLCSDILFFRRPFLVSMVQCLWPRLLIISPSIPSLLSFLVPEPLIFKYRVLGIKTTSQHLFAARYGHVAKFWPWTWRWKCLQLPKCDLIEREYAFLLLPPFDGGYDGWCCSHQTVPWRQVSQAYLSKYNAENHFKGSFPVLGSQPLSEVVIKTRSISPLVQLPSHNICLQCRRHKRSGLDPWIGRIPWRRAWQPTPVFLPGESHGQRSPVAMVHGVTKSQTWLKQLSTHNTPPIKPQTPR